jgi:hypothetical protein
MESKRDPTPNRGKAGGSEKATRRRRGRWFALLSVLGLFGLSYVFGAAAMFFRLPSSGLLSKAFIGARAWTESRELAMQPDGEMRPVCVGRVDQPGKTFDGFTLYACASMTSPSTWVSLINMKGEQVHRWSVSFARIWPNPPQLQRRQIDDSHVCIFACHLYPNGDLLVIFHGLERTVAGYGLARVDKDSHVLWSYAANVHHDVAVGEDGTIYTIVNRPLYERPRGLELVPLPWLADYLVVLSPDGKELKQPISILDALRNSPYSTLLSPLETPLKPEAKQELNELTFRELVQRQDVLHTNSVKVLTRAMAAKFPNLKAGDVLVSMRNLHALAVLDPDTGSVAWAACGPWHYQHDAQYLDNGHLLLFDNIGSPRGSRVLEYDPRSGRFPWSYPGIDNVPFFSSERGLCQRLPNGNTLIVNSEGKEIIEATPSKEVVWTCRTPDFITTARRYDPGRLSFLKAGQRPRP